MHGTIETALKRSIPLFGVCLGLQGLIEDYGGELQELDYPMQASSRRLVTMAVAYLQESKRLSMPGATTHW